MRSTFLALLAVLFSGLVLVGCDAGLAEMNTDPTQATAEQIEPQFLFTTAQLRTSGARYESWRANLIYSSTIVQHLAAVAGYWSGDKYFYNGSYSSALFDSYYPGPVRDIVNLVERTSEDPEQVNLNAAARIWKVVIFHRLTDMYGDIPYFEAGQGFLGDVYQPAYDPQEEIYKDMLAELEASVAAFDETKPTFGGGDLLYEGDVAQWRRFGNSMMLRLGLRLSKVDPALAQQWVQKAVDGGVMESNADIAYIQHTDGPDGINKNGNGEVFEVDLNMRLSDTFVSWMRERSDPRLGVYGQLPAEEASPNPGSTAPEDQRGLPNGLDSDLLANYDDGPSDNLSDILARYSLPNEALRGVDDPMFFQTYAEVEFMLAEAAERGWIAGDPAAHYENGVRAAMEYLQLYGPGAAIASGEIDAYLAANPFDPGRALEQINGQYWAATFLNEYEAWANWRRSGYPELTPVDYPGNVTGGTIPRRLRYPSNEAVVNPESFQEALSRQGITEDQNGFTARLWWDVPQ